MWSDLDNTPTQTGPDQRPNPRTRTVIRALLASVMCLVITGPALAVTLERHPLEPPDTSSPRGVMQGFLEEVDRARLSFYAFQATYDKEPGLYPSEAAMAELGPLQRAFRRAGRYLDLSEVPDAVAEETMVETIVLLKEILDRIQIPPAESIPDVDMMEAEELTRWRIPETSITIAQVSDGPQAGQYLFTSMTVERAEEFYDRVKHLPYKAGAWKGVYELYQTIPDIETVPWKLVKRLPAWAKLLVWDNAVWEWLALGMVVLLALTVILLVRSFARKRTQEESFRAAYYRLLLPVTLIGASIVIVMAADEIGITGDAYDVTVFAGGVIFFLAAAWAIMKGGILIAEGIVASPRIRTRSLDAALIRLSARLVAFGVAAAVLIVGAQRLGLPVVPLLAGLGVGGLALALAAQPTIENFIAGLTLYADRPVRMGDFCRVGDIVGTVEEIGMRSARLRTLDDTLVSIPNAEFSKLHLENYSKRRKIWYHPRIRLRYETTPDQLRYILVEVRKMLYAHPKVLQDPARIRFTEFGTYSLDLDFFAYVDATDFGEFLEIAEDLHLRTMDIITRAGSGLAVPAWRTQTESGAGVDQARAREAEERVKQWREQNRLYLPNFPSDAIAELAGTLDYPAKGTPGASKTD
ncbi:MAG: mechanosensitive ion channel family protein [Nitrospiraceae bacterium]